MSKMAELDWDIEYRVCEGMSNQAIAQELDIPIEMVEAWHTSHGLSNDDMGGILDLTKYPFVKEEMDPFATINS
jgi:hypothetical protein